MLVNLVVIGHCVIDHIFIEGHPYRPTLGGPATYASLAAKSLGANVKLVSLVGVDFPEEYAVWLSSKGIDVSGVRRLEGERTTSFTIRYLGGKRLMALRGRCPPLSAEDIPSDVDADAIHVGPTAHDVSLGALAKATENPAVLSLDPQGYLRSFSAEGAISDSPMPESVFHGIDVIKASDRELALATGKPDALTACLESTRRGCSISIATRGANGAVVVNREKVLSVPACRPRRVLDPTGAGDAFIGAFLVEFLRRHDLAWASAVGSASASFVVEGYGPSSFGNRDEVYARAEAVSEGIRMLQGVKHGEGEGGT